MSRPNIRRRVAGVAGLALAGSLVLAGCTLPPDTTAGAASAGASGGGGEVVAESTASGAALAVPSTWPTAVPQYDGGTLTAADSDETGSYVDVTWRVTSTPKEIAKEYGDTLVAAGFTAGEPYADDTSALTEYTGNGLSVTVYASVPVDGSSGTDLAVSIQPAS